MKTLGGLFILLSISFRIFSQDVGMADSLENKLKSFNAHKAEMNGSNPDLGDSVKVNLLYELSKAYWYNNFARSKEYATQSLEIAKQINYKKGIAKGYYSLCMIEMNKGNFSEAFEYCNRTLTAAKEINDNYLIADVHCNLGFLYNEAGNPAEAQEHCFASIKLAEEINYKECISGAYSNLGSLYLSQNNLSDAIKNYLYALKVAEQINYKIYVAAIYHNLAITDIMTGKPKAAFDNTLRALKINKEIGNLLWEGYNNNLLGGIMDRQNQNREALKYYLESVNISKKMNEKAMYSSALGNAGWIYLKLKDYSRARFYLNESVAVSKEIGYLDGLNGIYENLASLDSAEGNWQSAFENYRTSVTYHDSVINEGNTKKIVQTQMQYEFKKKEAVRLLELERQKIIKYTIIGGFIVALIFSLVIFKRYKEKKSANMVLEKTLQELKSTQQQLVQSEKLAAFGVMASRVAHEIQNPLNFVNNFSEFSGELINEIVCSDKEEERKEVAKSLLENLDKINMHGKRASSIIKQLQEHSRAGTAHEYFENDKM